MYVQSVRLLRWCRRAGACRSWGLIFWSLLAVVHPISSEALSSAPGCCSVAGSGGWICPALSPKHGSTFSCSRLIFLWAQQISDAFDIVSRSCASWSSTARHSLSIAEPQWSLVDAFAGVLNRLQVPLFIGIFLSCSFVSQTKLSQSLNSHLIDHRYFTHN